MNIALSRALRRDGEESTSEDAESKKAGGVTTLRVEWTDFEPAVLRDLAADLVVGADILYDPLSVPPLLNALECLLAPPAAAGKSSEEEEKGEEEEGVLIVSENKNAETTVSANDENSAEALLREIASTRRALLVTALRQPETLQKFVDEATARDFAPKDVTDVLGYVPTSRGGGFLGLRLEDDRSRLRVHLLSPPRGGYRNGSALEINSKSM